MDPNNKIRDLFNKIGLKEDDIYLLDKIKFSDDVDKDRVDEDYIKEIFDSIENDFLEWIQIPLLIMYLRVIIIHPETQKSYIEFTKKFKKIRGEKLTIKIKSYISPAANMTMDEYKYNDDYNIDKDKLIRINKILFKESLRYLVTNGAVYQYFTECLYAE